MSLLNDASLLITPNAYKQGKLYSVIPSNGNGDFSVTRATTATRVNAAGLVELVPYNLLTYSEIFSNVAWAKNLSTITANITTAPNGTLTADKLVENTSNGFHWLAQNNIGSFQSLTASCYFKKSERDWGLIRIRTNINDRYAFFNLNNGTIGTVDVQLTASIQDVGNGWYRCSVSTTSPTTATNPIVFGMSNADNVISYLGDGTSGVFLWGAQLNEGTSALDYQMTETRLNIPRLDYSLGSCPNILLEPQRTNLSTWSEDFSNIVWSKSVGVSVSTNSAIAPNGLMTADVIDFGAANRFLSQATTATTGVAITGNFYIKGIAGQTIQIAVAGVDQLFTLDGTWQRLGHTRTTAGTVFGLNLNTFGSATARVVFLWGAQLEAGAYATSYIPTSSASVTRNADVISNASATSLIGQTEGTIFIDFDNLLQTSYANEYLFSLLGNSQNLVWIRKETGTNKYSARVLANGSTAVTIVDIPVLNGRNKIALAYKSGQTALYLNGSLVANDADAYTFNASLTRMDLASLNGSLNGLAKIYAAALFPTRLTNTQLAALTA